MRFLVIKLQYRSADIIYIIYNVMYLHLGNILTFLIYIESHGCSCVHNLNYVQLREVNGQRIYIVGIFYLKAMVLIFLFGVYELIDYYYCSSQVLFSICLSSTYLHDHILLKNCLYILLYIFYSAMYSSNVNMTFKI